MTPITLSDGAPDNPPQFTPETIHAHLSTLTLGRRIEVHKQVGSTNDLAKAAGRCGEPEGLVILAEEQLAGRGRLGRKWHAPPGCCILCSAMLRPRFSPEHAFYLTIAASLAIYRACRELFDTPTKDQEPAPNAVKGRRTKEGSSAPYSNSSKPCPRAKRRVNTQNHALERSEGSTLAIKWPNDVLINGRKVAGVLSESEFRGGEWAFAVVGFGINVNMRPEELGELRGAATSLSIELGRTVDRAALLAHILAEFESVYFALQSGQFVAAYRGWAAALDTIGKRVTVEAPDSMLVGQAVRVDPDGALVLRPDSGEERRVLAGDVTLQT